MLTFLMFSMLAKLDDTVVPPFDRFIRQIGRFDGRDAAGPRCQWTASALEIRFTGSALNATINEKGNDWVQVFIDDAPYRSIHFKDGVQTVAIADHLNGREHTVRIVKCTEPFVGTLQFQGFTITGGNILRPKPRGRRIEVIGDSISCGFGNLGLSVNELFKPETEDGTKAYGALAADALNADYQCIAWSGRKLWPDNDIPSIYDLTIPTETSTAWPSRQQIPDAVVINLGTNDFGKDNPDEKGWCDAYARFIAHLRTNYPKAEIYTAIGSMMSDNWPPEHKALSTIRAYITSVVAVEKRSGDTHVHLLEFDTQNVNLDGGGSSWHPNVKTHHNMAARLVGALRRDLGWK